MWNKLDYLAVEFTVRFLKMYFKEIYIPVWNKVTIMT